MSKKGGRWFRRNSSGAVGRQLRRGGPPVRASDRSPLQLKTSFLSRPAGSPGLFIYLLLLEEPVQEFSVFRGHVETHAGLFDENEQGRRGPFFPHLGNPLHRLAQC